MLYGAIEAGGTKFVCAVVDENGQFVEKLKLDTEIPETTIPLVLDFFRNYELKAIGIGSFGPIDINTESPTYGNITSTPKRGWGQFPFVKTVKESFNIPVFFSTDVNAAALGEWKMGAAKGLDSCLYITIGTGIGAGAIVNGRLLEGLTHPEMGHILIRRHKDDPFKGRCNYHQDCFEGLAAGPAIEARWGKKGFELSNESRVWKIEAYYIAQALMQYMLILSPKKIILGGGVMKQMQLFPSIRQEVKRLLNGYLDIPAIFDSLDSYIVPPGLGDYSGITGAYVGARSMVE